MSKQIKQGDIVRIKCRNMVAEGEVIHCEIYRKYIPNTYDNRGKWVIDGYHLMVKDGAGLPYSWKSDLDGGNVMLLNRSVVERIEFSNTGNRDEDITVEVSRHRWVSGGKLRRKRRLYTGARAYAMFRQAAANTGLFLIDQRETYASPVTDVARID